MPRDIFLRKASMLEPAMANILQLARMFRTSLDATARRIASLGVWKCVIIWGTPEKMIGERGWAMRIQNYKSSLPQSPPYPRSKYVWWGGDAMKEAFDSSSAVTRTVTIGGCAWRFEGLRHVHSKPSGELERRVIALLLPSIVG